MVDGARGNFEVFRPISSIALVQRAMAARNGRMAMRYAISTISNNPNIARTAMKVGKPCSTTQSRHKSNYRQNFLTNPIKH